MKVTLKVLCLCIPDSSNNIFCQCMWSVSIKMYILEFIRWIAMWITFVQKYNRFDFHPWQMFESVVNMTYMYICSLLILNKPLTVFREAKCTKWWWEWECTLRLELVQMTMDHISVKVKVGNKLREPIQFSAGVKQGDCLSNTPFHFALHIVMKSIFQKGTFSSNLARPMFTRTT